MADPEVNLTNSAQMGRAAGRDRKPLVLSELSWPEVAEFQDGVEMVLIPFGSTEQHGPNLALSADAAIAESLCLLASATMYPRLLVAPTVPWGISPHHMDFPGTITLEADTLLRVFYDMVDSLTRHEFRRFLIVNAHGGNKEISGVAAQDLGNRCELEFCGSVFVWDLIPDRLKSGWQKTERVGHACELEVSDALFLRPQIVKRDALGAADFREGGWDLRDTLARYGVRAASNMSDITNNGALGDATLASVEAGRERMEAAVESLGDIVAAVTRSSITQRDQVVVEKTDG